MSNLGYFKIENALTVNRSGIPSGKLVLPEGLTVDGDLIAFGECDMYLHCVISGSGEYYGIFKSEDKNHLYQHILNLNNCSD